MKCYYTRLNTKNGNNKKPDKKKYQYHLVNFKKNINKLIVNTLNIKKAHKTQM